MTRSAFLALSLLAVLSSPPALAQSREQWIELGARIHGGFGVLIPIGIRIGLDAVERLKPEPRGLSVTYYTGERAPCPCIADGVMIATQASPGQGTLQIAGDKAPDGQFAVIDIRNRKTGETLRYTVGNEWGPRIMEWNRSLGPSGRYDAAMDATGLFRVESR
jgi:formylmethanofuran dehydrogenase subunit E